MFDSFRKTLSNYIYPIESKSFSEGSTVVNINDLASLDDSNISPTKALQCTAVWACVSLIAESIACMPIEIIRRTERSYNKLKAHPILDLMRCPNAWMDSYDLIDWVCNSLLLTGNAYLYVVRDNSGIARELLPIQPYAVSVNQDQDWTVHYYVHFEDIQREVDKSDLIHIKGKSLDSLVGLSPIACARTAISLNIKAQDYSLNYYSNGGSPKAILTHPHSLSADARDRLRTAFDQNYSGSNSFRTAVLEEGLQYQQIGISNADMQYIESRKFGCNEIARLYRVPSHLIMSTDNVSNWGTGIQEQTKAFLQYSLMPWIRRIETSLNAVLISDSSEEIRLNVDQFLRGSTKERFEGYNLALQWGYLSINEIRDQEGLSPVPDGDSHYIPLNYSILGSSATSAIIPEQNQEGGNTFGTTV